MKTGVCEELCVIKLCVKDVRDKVGSCVQKMVCDKVVRDKVVSDKNVHDNFVWGGGGGTGGGADVIQNQKDAALSCWEKKTLL